MLGRTFGLLKVKITWFKKLRIISLQSSRCRTKDPFLKTTAEKWLEYEI